MFNDKIKKLTGQLYPSGRVFNLSENSILSRLHDALAVSENNMLENALSIFDVILPDNDNFTEDDAERWEQRLGLITNSAVSLADRKLAIIRKMNHPGTILARQSWDYLQDQLQLAGFDVYVHENIPEQSPLSILQPLIGVGQLGDGQLGDFQLGDVYTYYSQFYTCAQLGNFQLGDFQLSECIWNQKVVNDINEAIDATFNIGNNYRSVFYICGATLGEFANVDENRKDEFRQLILKLKPVQTVAFLFINYV